MPLLWQEQAADFRETMTTPVESLAGFEPWKIFLAAGVVMFLLLGKKRPLDPLTLGVWEE